jgi:hypothetical protein
LNARYFSVVSANVFGSAGAGGVSRSSTRAARAFRASSFDQPASKCRSCFPLTWSV